jgi:hypothetical protein
MNIQLIIFIIITIICHLNAMRFAWTKGKMHYKDKLSHVYDIIHSNFSTMHSTMYDTHVLAIL